MTKKIQFNSDYYQVHKILAYLTGNSKVNLSTSDLVQLWIGVISTIILLIGIIIVFLVYEYSILSTKEIRIFNKYSLLTKVLLLSQAFYSIMKLIDLLEITKNRSVLYNNLLLINMLVFVMVTVVQMLYLTALLRSVWNQRMLRISTKSRFNSYTWYIALGIITPILCIITPMRIFDFFNDNIYSLSTSTLGYTLLYLFIKWFVKYRENLFYTVYYPLAQPLDLEYYKDSISKYGIILSSIATVVFIVVLGIVVPIEVAISTLLKIKEVCAFTLHSILTLYLFMYIPSKKRTMQYYYHRHSGELPMNQGNNRNIG
ncbi:hypothetical protein NEOKW01_0583 [Nematocida sp. AWRm80]|nr:hypothetical protein NEOKW01_0583 [Nematocida sp. AWRm80]